MAPQRLARKIEREIAMSSRAEIREARLDGGRPRGKRKT